MGKQIETEIKKCSSCGGNLYFDPNEGCLKCYSCEKKHPIVLNSGYARHSFAEKPKVSQSSIDWENNNKVMRCSNCGANIVLNKLEFSNKCPYCESAIVAEQSADLPGIMPDSVIPFKFDENVASQYFANSVKKKFFVPKRFKKNLPESDVNGIYMPSFSFDVNTSSTYSGVLFDEKTIKNNDGTSTTTRNEFNISGVEKVSFESFLIESSSNFVQKEIEQIKPYDHTETFAFDEDYIRGYVVEKNNESVEDGYEKAKALMKDKIKESILKHYSYDGITRLSFDTMYFDEFYSYKIVPVYRINFNYKNKLYSPLINGQTGKLGGKLPVSAAKVVFVVLSVLAVIGAIVLATFITK